MFVKVVFLCLILTVWGQTDNDKIFDEDIDVDSIINNDRILDTYLKCFYSTGPCSSRGETVKGKITQVFSTVCEDCSQKQKKLLHHILNVFIPKRPDDWKKILEIYDSEGKYETQLNAFIQGPTPEA